MKHLFDAIQEIDKPFQRQVAILKAFENTFESVGFEKLAKDIDCSEATLRDTISIMNANFRGFAEIEYINSKELMLSTLSHISIDSLVTRLSKHTSAFQIIDLIFKEHDLQMYDVLLSLQVSRSTFYKVVKQVNDFLTEHFNISIQSRGILQFAGSEIDIRIFLLSFYSEFGDAEIIYPGINDQIKADLVAMDEFGINRLYFCHFRLSLWLTILNLRIKNGHYIQKDEKMLDSLIVDKDDFSKFEKFVQNYRSDTEELVFGEMPSIEIKFTYLSRLTCVTFLTLESGEVLERCYAYPPACDDMFSAMKSLVAKLYPLNMFETVHVKKLLAYLNNLYILENLSPLFAMVPESMGQFVQATFSGYFGAWHDALKQFKNELIANGFILSDLKNIASSLAILSSSIPTSNADEGIHIIFAFQGAVGYDNYLKEVSLRFLMQNVTAEYYLEEILTADLIKEKSVSLIVSNYDLGEGVESLPIKYIRFSNVATLKDWTNLWSAIGDLIIELERKQLDDVQ